MTEPNRLSRSVVTLVGCSRAEAERYIENGFVRVDGVVVEDPRHPVTTETITLDEGATPALVLPATIIVHKASGDVITKADGEGRLLAAPLSLDTRAENDPLDIRPLRRHLVRLYEAVPLPASASGLMLLSQDRAVLAHLDERGTKLEQEWLVDVDGPSGTTVLKQLERGGSFDGRPIGPCKVSWQSEGRLRFAVANVRPGQLEAHCASVDLVVTATKRLRVGRVGLAKIPAGTWRYLPPGERF